ncbi:MAG: hypothetical protein PHD82_08130 [Candidatus Riflebacteria bacterium]|jgi:sugar lactone lactonase YvrE|nr:hypothetical protein [Candidatus Riflebacteria bacterium]
MKKTTVTLLAVMLLALSTPAFSNWELKFGTEDERVGVLAPMNEEDFPDGPGAFRVVENDLWVLDSVKGRVLCVNADGSFSKVVKLPGLKAEFVLTDFALQRSPSGTVEAVVAIDMRAKEIVVVGIDGKELRRIKAEQMMQLDEVDVDTEGQIYVGDYAACSISVFSNSGELLRTLPWQVSGFVADLANNLHMLDYKEGSGHALVTLAKDGKEIARQEIGLPDMQNPRIWNVNAAGEKLVSFVPPSGDPSQQMVYTFSAAGETTGKAAFSNPYYINRFLAAGKEGIWLVKADYLKAPDVPVRVESVALTR